MRAKAYIDASNLFYGSQKATGWSIDYKKLLAYLREKYEVKEVWYFGGVETHAFYFDTLKENTVPLDQLNTYFTDLLAHQSMALAEKDRMEALNHLKRIKFYRKLQEFGFKLILKPVKSYINETGKVTRKANCDVDMTLRLMQDVHTFDRAIILSGDGDFLPVLKHLSHIAKKEVFVLAFSKRTAKEIKKFAKERFLDFEYLRERIKWTG